MLDFEIETENLNKDTKLIIVRNFDDKETALIYFLSIIRKQQVFKSLAGKKFINFIISNNNFREMLSDRSYDKYLQFFVKNYSIFTTGEFPDQDLESPEELMAKLKQDKQDQLVEKGEFVLIDTDNGNYNAPEPKEQIFKLDYSAPHSYVIKINEVRYKTGFLMRDLVRYNSSNYRAKRLKVMPNNLKESTLLLVSGFPNAYEANLYLKETNSNKELFSSLNELEYETFIISNENLNKLRETNNTDEWNSFYRNNFVYNKPPKPISELPKAEEETKEPVVKNDNEDKENEAHIEKTVSEPEAIKKPIEEKNNQVIVADTSTNVTKPIKNNTIVDNEAIKPANKVYEGPFKDAPETMHNLIYLLPKSGSNKTLLTTYLTRLNAINYSGQNLKVEVQEFDNIRSMVVVSGIGNKEKAIEYFNKVKVDNRIIMSLRNANHKSYIVNEPNLIELKQSKDINEYQKFYDSFFE